MEKNKNNIRWLTRTAALVALLLSIQWATAGTQVFAGQYITGSLVNAVLAVAALLCGLSTGLVVAVLSPFFAFALGIGPKLLLIVPMIALGNCVYVLVLYLLTAKPVQKWRQAIGVALAAAAKFLTLYLAVVQILLPILGDSLKAPQIKTFTAMFSWPQLITALLGGTLAFLLLPILRKAIRK